MRTTPASPIDVETLVPATAALAPAVRLSVNPGPLRRPALAVALSLIALGTVPADAEREFVFEDHSIDQQDSDDDRAERNSAWATPITGKPGLDNLFLVSPTYYRGAQPNAEGFATLEEMGVKTIINLRGVSSDRGEMRKAGVDLEYFHVSFKPWHPEDEDVVEFLQIVLDADNHPVFVHCQHGADRTGLMTAIYRMAVEGWSREDARIEMRKGGYGFHRIWKNLDRYLQKVDVEVLADEARKANGAASGAVD